MEVEPVTGFVYDALPGLTVSQEGSVDDGGTAAGYTVSRNEIASSPGDFLQDIPSEEFFSLDVFGTGVSPFVSSTPVTTAPSPTAQRQVESELESAWFRPGCRFKSPMLQLHKEILDFCDFISPTHEEQASRASAVQSITDVVKHIWPRSKVEVFGSFRTGLYLPTSDVDVVILDSKVRTPQIGLYALARALSQRGIAKKMQVIPKARVPIVKFVEKSSGISFDISFDMDSGPKAADFIQNAVKKLPPLRPLCLILKVFLQQRELNEVYSGGIGSYALLAMLITMLQVHWRGQESRNYGRQKEQNLGVLLVNFFDFYGRKLNNDEVGISCNSRNTFFLKSAKGFYNFERPYLLSIQDPQEPDNDIGKNSYNYFKVKSAFSTAYFSLTNAPAILNLGPHRSILGTIIRPDPILLNRKGGNHGELTFNDMLSGAGEPLDPPRQQVDDVVYNWPRLIDEEPLPRGNIVTVDAGFPSRKRKSPKSMSKFGKSTEKHKENCKSTEKYKENGKSTEKRKENGLLKSAPPKIQKKQRNHVDSMSASASRSNKKWRYRNSGNNYDKFTQSLGHYPSIPPW